MESLSELENNDSILSHCIDKKHQCELCDTVLDSYRCLKKQITDIYKDGNLYKCLDCIEIIHKETEIEHKCDSCGKLFGRFLSKLQRHIESVHERRKDHECNICGKCFSLRSILKKHLYNVHDVTKTTCKTCGRSFTTAKYLRMHATMHTAVHEVAVDYKCESCGKSFSYANGLKGHIKSRVN